MEFTHQVVDRLLAVVCDRDGDINGFSLGVDTVIEICGDVDAAHGLFLIFIAGAADSAGYSGNRQLDGIRTVGRYAGGIALCPGKQMNKAICRFFGSYDMKQHEIDRFFGIQSLIKIVVNRNFDNIRDILVTVHQLELSHQLSHRLFADVGDMNVDHYNIIFTV